MAGSGEILKSVEFKKLRPNFTSVIGTDDPFNNYGLISRSLEESFPSGSGLQHGPILMANNIIDLLNKSLTGNNGEQSDVVFLGHDFTEASINWNPSMQNYYSNLELLFKQASVNFKPYRSIFNDVKDWGKMPNDLYLPDSIHLAMWLRILGYKGDIFVISGQDVQAEKVIREIRDLAEVNDKYQPVIPMNGLIFRTGFNIKRIKVSKNKVRENKFVSKEIEGGMRDALRFLLTNQPIKSK